MAHLMEHLKSSLSARRAWIEIVFRGWTLNINGSLSARRAWIEMTYVARLPRAQVVALRKESVDRNAEDWLNAGSLSRSLSARRAWIEIRSYSQRSYWYISSLSARRAWIEISKIWYCGTSIGSLSARRAWIEISVKDLNAHLYYRRSPQGERG